jgi:GNAT superfamily N-acetyltransferase
VSGYRTRLATDRDLEVVLHHRRRMFEDMGYTDPQALGVMLEVSRPLLQGGLRDGSYRGWLVEDAGGAIVAGGGVILLQFQPHPMDPRPQRAWVVNMFTEPEHRRRGLARLLMDTIVAWCRAEGLRFLFLHASDEGKPLYEGLGFVASNEMRLELQSETKPRRV